MFWITLILTSSLFGVLRFHRQLSEPCLPFPQSDGHCQTPYPPQSPNHFPRNSRPHYHRQMSEPMVPMPPHGFKKEIVDPRYNDQCEQRMGPPRAPLFHQMSIKQEPRDFSFDAGEFREEAVWYVWFWDRLNSHAVTLGIVNRELFLLIFLKKFKTASHLLANQETSMEQIIRVSSHSTSSDTQ